MFFQYDGTTKECPKWNEFEYCNVILYFFMTNENFISKEAGIEFKVTMTSRAELYLRHDFAINYFIFIILKPKLQYKLGQLNFWLIKIWTGAIIMKPVNKKLSDLMDINLRYRNYGPSDRVGYRATVISWWGGGGVKERETVCVWEGYRIYLYLRYKY